MRFHFFLLAIFFSFSALAQEEPGSKRIPQEEDFNPDYVHIFKDSLVLRVFTIQKTNSLLIKDSSGNNQLTLKPNENTNLGFGFNYRWLGLNMAFNFPFVNNDDETYGNSKSFNLLVYAYPRKFGVNIFFQTIQGYYVQNMSDYNKIWDNNVFYKRPDIRTGALGGSFFYIFNYKKYSYRSVFVQNEVQTKSAGSFFLGGNISLIGISGDSSIIPESAKHNFDSSTYILNSSYLELGIQGGYTANIIFLKHLFINFTLTPGISLQGGTILTEDPRYNNRDKQGIRPSFRTSFAFGYNKDRWYLALNSTFSTLSLGKSLSYQYGRVMLVFAFRLRPPKFGRKSHPAELLGS
jgi:Domain of unknown function (DUF4421)